MHATKVTFEERDYGKNPLSEQELRDTIADGPIENFLNTRTSLCRELKMKNNPLSNEEAIRLILKDPNPLTRPVIVKREVRPTGFSEADVRQLLCANDSTAPWKCAWP